MSESNQRSKTLIRELYLLSESGALDNIDSETAEAACDFIKNFIDPIVSYKQAAKITGKSIHAIHCKVSRSGIPVEQTKGIRWKFLRKIIDKSI